MTFISRSFWFEMAVRPPCSLSGIIISGKGEVFFQFHVFDTIAQGFTKPQAARRPLRQKPKQKNEKRGRRTAGKRVVSGDKMPGFCKNLGIGTYIRVEMKGELSRRYAKIQSCRAKKRDIKKKGMVFWRAGEMRGREKMRNYGRIGWKIRRERAVCLRFNKKIMR